MTQQFVNSIILLIILLSLPSCQRGKNHAELLAPPAPSVSTTEHQFGLMKWTGKSWELATSVRPSPKGVNVIIHGFEPAKRVNHCEHKPDDVFFKHGLRDYRYPDRLVSPPPQIQRETYALMWDSRASNPMALEKLLMVAPKKSQREIKELIDSDSIDDESDTEFFKNLLKYYSEIMSPYQGPRPHLAGFSKGGHVAIKLAHYAHFRQANRSIAPSTVALLDPYVGPGWSNNNIGISLINQIKQLQNEHVSFLNIMTSEIYQFNILKVPLADTRFRDDLRRVVGEITIKRNPKEQEILDGLAPVTGNKSLDQVILNHVRAPQIWFGSVLICDPKIPTLNSSSAEYRNIFQKHLTMETPHEITDWIYNGTIRPTCPQRTSSQ